MARFFPIAGTFRSLAIYNYRLWAAGAVVSNVGTWMQRVAQDWSSPSSPTTVRARWVW
jgi:hypothetical protein